MTHYLHTHLDLMAQRYFQQQSKAPKRVPRVANTQPYAKLAGGGSWQYCSYLWDRLPLVAHYLGHVADVEESSFEIVSYAFATFGLADLNLPLISA